MTLAKCTWQVMGAQSSWAATRHASLLELRHCLQVHECFSASTPPSNCGCLRSLAQRWGCGVRPLRPQLSEGLPWQPR
eukprot:7972679-Alexandrium_andersonii.AAC.1